MSNKFIRQVVIGLATLLFAPFAIPSPVTYDFGIRYVANSNVSVFGDRANIELTFDNGSSSRNNQTYRVSDLVDVAISVNGGSFALGGNNPVSIIIGSNGGAVLATTNNFGRIAMQYIDVSDSIVEIHDLVLNTSASVWAWSDFHQNWISLIEPPSPVSGAKGLFHVVPEPSSLLLVLLALLFIFIIRGLFIGTWRKLQ